MATVFTPPGRKTLYHRAQIPKKLRRHFKGRVELWRSLKTTDPDEAKLKSLQWDTRAQRVFLTLKKHGATMSPAEIDALIERWMDAELEAGEDHRATHPIGEWTDDADLIRVSQIEDLYEDLGRCNYRRVEHDADEILKAASFTLLDHDSVEFQKLCRRLLLAKMDLLNIETERWNGVYKDRKVSAAPAPVAAPPVKKTPLFSVIAKKYLAENPRAQRTADQVRIEFDKFLKVIGGDRPIASIYLHALGSPQDVAEMLTGHTASSVHNKYEHRNLTPLTRLRDGLEKMQFPAVLKALEAKGGTE